MNLQNFTSEELQKVANSPDKKEKEAFWQQVEKEIDFFEATGKVFPQSIVLVKDLYKGNDEMKINDLGKKLLKDPNVKTMYVNQVNEGVEQVDLVTTKIKLK